MLSGESLRHPTLRLAAFPTMATNHRQAEAAGLLRRRRETMKFSVDTDCRLPTVVRHQGIVIILALDDNCALMVYSDFNYPDDKGRPCKTILVRKIETIVAAHK